MSFHCVIGKYYHLLGPKIELVDLSEKNLVFINTHLSVYFYLLIQTILMTSSMIFIFLLNYMLFLQFSLLNNYKNNLDSPT